MECIADNWVGEPEQVSSEVTAQSNGSWSGDPAQGGEWTAGVTVTREVTDTVEGQVRTGVTTSVVEDFKKQETIELDSYQLFHS